MHLSAGASPHDFLSLVLSSLVLAQDKMAVWAAQNAMMAAFHAGSPCPELEAAAAMGSAWGVGAGGRRRTIVLLAAQPGSLRRALLVWLWLTCCIQWWLMRAVSCCCHLDACWLAIVSQLLHLAVPPLVRRHGAAVWRAAGQCPAGLPAHAPGKPCKRAGSAALPHHQPRQQHGANTATAA